MTINEYGHLVDPRSSARIDEGLFAIENEIRTGGDIYQILPHTLLKIGVVSLEYTPQAVGVVPGLQRRELLLVLDTIFALLGSDGLRRIRSSFITRGGRGGGQLGSLILIYPGVRRHSED